MTLKRKRFIDAYLGEANGNATQAAVIAGYSEKSAKAIGSELLTFPDIQKAVSATLAKADLSTAARLEKVRVIADAEPKDIKALDVLKANELILKVNGALKDKQSDSRITVQIGFLTAAPTTDHSQLTIDVSRQVMGEVMASLPQVLDIARD